MNIFCDTNIIMEYLQQRQFAAQVGQILSHASQNHDELYISVGSFYTITYLAERYLKADASLTKMERIARLRLILNGILETFRLANQFMDTMRAGVNDVLFDDLEDSYQAHVAIDMGCDVLLTINEKHFLRFNNSSAIKMLTPSAFIETFF